jgi:hypothetical protein
VSEVFSEFDRMWQLPDEPTKTWGEMKELSVREVFSPYVATEVEDLGVFF